MKTLLFPTDFYAEKVHFEKTSWNHTKWLSGTFLFSGNSNKCLLEQLHENSHCSVRWVGADNRSLFLAWSGLGWAAKFKFVWSDSLSCAFLTLHLFFLSINIFIVLSGQVSEHPHAAIFPVRNAAELHQSRPSGRGSQGLHLRFRFFLHSLTSFLDFQVL